MLGCRLEYGEDDSRRGPQSNRPGPGKSFIAFDFAREILVIKGGLKLPEQSLPSALKPLDAELSFDDIASGGIQIVDTPRPRQDGQPDQYEVTVTVSCRRPPKFFIQFKDDREPSRDRKGGSSKTGYRRRATAMDFAISGAVRVYYRPPGPILKLPRLSVIPIQSLPFLRAHVDS